EHSEFVPPEPRGSVPRADRAVDLVADHAQYLVAGGMAEAVVHRLEVVDVHEERCRRASVALLALQRVFDAVPEEPTIREAGDRVVERLVLELLLEELALADVASVHDDPAHVRIERQVGPEALDVEPPAVAVAPAELDQLGRVVLLAGEFGEQGHDAGHVVGMDEVFDEPRAEELLDLIAHDA